MDEPTSQFLPSTKKWIIGGATASFALVALFAIQSNSATSGSNKYLSQNVELTDSNDFNTLQDTSSSSPHIFMFTVDDMGWNDMGYNSGDLSEATPFMKSLAHKGVTLTHYYGQPSCTPSRVTMMTGKYAFRNGFQNYELQHSDAIGVPLSNKMLPHYMKDLGYKTVGFGKWNIGHCNSKYLPSERGFDHYLGYLCPGHGYRDFNCGMSAGYKDMIEGWALVKDDGTTEYKWSNGADYEGTYDTELYRDKAQMAIEKHFNTDSETPLFMWLAQHGIHAEYDSDPIPPESLLTADNKNYLKVLKKRLDEVGSEDEGYGQFFKMRMITASVLMSIDNSLRNLVETLDGLGKLADSVIFVNSDNGGDVFYRKGHPGNNYPLRSEKFLYFEGGIRVPAFVFAPGRISEARQGSKYHGLMHHVDLISTFIHIAGGSTDEFAVEYSDLDSINQWPAIVGDTTSPRSEIVFNMPRSKNWKLGQSETSEGVAIRTSNYKLLINHAYDYWFSPSNDDDFLDYTWMKGAECSYSWVSTPTSSSCTYENYLFNVLDDPNETTNLFYDSDYNDIKESLINRVYTILEAEPNDYGKIMYEAYTRGNSGSDYSTYFAGNGDYVVPFDCEVIP